MVAGSAFGFILVTTDPDVTHRGKGLATDLVRHRIERAEWPLFDRTPNRERIVVGVPVAFYVAGTGPDSGHLIATATVGGRRRYRPESQLIDPEGHLAERPSIVLALSDIQWIESPIVFRERLPDLAMKPKNMSNWGAVLMGGARAVSQDDWRLLFG